MIFSPEMQCSKNPDAWLADCHGYRFEGDVVFINADIACDESRLAGRQWALQLWTQSGVMVASLPLGVLQPDGAGALHVEGVSAALPPADHSAHQLSLVLVALNGAEAPTVVDFATYPQPVVFAQPSLKGTICCDFADDQLHISLQCLENPRPADNLSGTLALELWVLESAYTGGSDWRGMPVASVVLGTLGGQQSWHDWRVGTHAAPMPADGYLTLMLREWTPSGYVTRDYRSLARPSISVAANEAPVPVQPLQASSTVAAPAQALAATPAQPPAATSAPVPTLAPAPAPKSGKKAAVPEMAPPAKPVVTAKQPVAAPIAPIAPSAAKADVKVSINSASKTALTAVKGISAVIAVAIIAARPYASLDDLIRAKGVGPKLLEKIRPALTL